MEQAYGYPWLGPWTNCCMSLINIFVFFRGGPGEGLPFSRGGLSFRRPPLFRPSLKKLSLSGCVHDPLHMRWRSRYQEQLHWYGFGPLSRDCSINQLDNEEVGRGSSTTEDHPLLSSPPSSFLHSVEMSVVSKRLTGYNIALTAAGWQNVDKDDRLQTLGRSHDG